MLENLDIKINNQILSIISEIDEFKGSWKLLGRMAPEKLRALKKVATIESVGSSNRIEGNKLTDKQVEELLSRIKKQSFANRDEEEVEVELSNDDLTPGELVYDVDADDAGNLFDFDDDL